MRTFPQNRRMIAVAFAAGVLALAIWLMNFASRYQVPMIVDGVAPEFRILHVDKRGLSVREAQVNVFKNASVYIEQGQRLLFQYRFEVRLTRGVLSPALYQRAHASVKLSPLSLLNTGPVKTLRSWNAEGWYVVLDSSRLVAFTSENHIPPPPEITDIFSEIEKLPAMNDRILTVKDVCMGFCYPLTALKVRSD